MWRNLETTRVALRRALKLLQAPCRRPVNIGNDYLLCLKKVLNVWNCGHEVATATAGIKKVSGAAALYGCEQKSSGDHGCDEQRLGPLAQTAALANAPSRACWAGRKGSRSNARSSCSDLIWDLFVGAGLGSCLKDHIYER